mgnify:FL=1
MNTLVILGASGHGKVIADIGLKNEYENILFLDDNATGKCLGFPIVGTSEDLERLNDGRTDFVIAVGNNAIRRRIAESHDVNWVKLIHPSAQIALGVQISKGTVVMAGAIVNAEVTIGEHCIVNSGAIVEHDNVLGDFVHISPNAALGGTVHVGDNTHIGIGVVVKNNIDICSNCTIGAGTVVVENLFIEGTYVGTPAKIMGGGGGNI